MRINSRVKFLLVALFISVITISIIAVSKLSGQNQDFRSRADERPATPPNLTPAPTCKPRPPCLDATPRCYIPETSDMCPPTILNSPTPTPSQKGPFNIHLSNLNTEITCKLGDPNCYYQTVMIAKNRIDKPLYKTTMYQVSPNNIMSFIGFNGQWTSSQSATTNIVYPGQEAINTLVKVIPPKTLGKTYSNFYIDGQTCNTPPDCAFYGASGFTVIINVVDSPIATATPKLSPTPTIKITPTPTPNFTKATPSIRSVNPTTIYLNSPPRIGRLIITGTGFLSGKNDGKSKVYRSLFFRDYRGITRYIKNIGTGWEIVYPTWNDNTIDTGNFTAGQLADIAGMGGNPYIYQPVKVFVEIYDYTSSGKRSLGISNALTIYKH